MGGGREGGGGGRGGPSSEQNVQWTGTKWCDGGLLDWPSQARAPRFAKTLGPTPVQTRELAAWFSYLRAARPGLEQYVASSPSRSHSDTIRIHSKAMKTSIAQLLCPEEGVCEDRRLL